jgi:hypothetical protein
MGAMFSRAAELVTKLPLDPTSTLCAISLITVAALVWHARPLAAQRPARRRAAPAPAPHKPGKRGSRAGLSR